MMFLARILFYCTYCSTEHGVTPKSFCLKKYFYLVDLVYLVTWFAMANLSKSKLPVAFAVFWMTLLEVFSASVADCWAWSRCF